MVGHADRLLHMARAATTQQHVPTSDELRRARHLAQDGATWQQIRVALGWDCCMATCRNRLRRYNIFVRGGRNRVGVLAKFGGETGLPEYYPNAAAKNYRTLTLLQRRSASARKAARTRKRLAALRKQTTFDVTPPTPAVDAASSKSSTT